MTSEEVERVLKALFGHGVTHGYQEYIRWKKKKRIGLVVNPIAGMGGRVGLKGTDGREVLEKAIELGAKPIAPLRAVETLRYLADLKDAFELITYPKEMGEYEALEAGFKPVVVGSLNSEKTSAEDTKNAVKEFSKINVDLILFVGGDGTARDILEVLSSVKKNIPVLGIPSGVKMHSSVFAINPGAAAKMVSSFIRQGLSITQGEVMDIDEEEFRKGRLSAKLYGYLLVPYEPTLLQSKKNPTLPINEELLNQLEIARYLAENMEHGVFYILGPGSTVSALTRLLGVEKSLLGVDIIKNHALVAKDVNEKQILEIITNKTAKIVVTPIGGQGFIFGRGNQQISPEVIRKVGKENIIVIATKNKLKNIKKLRVDTGDTELDKSLRGKIKVIVGYHEEALVEVE